MPGKSDDLERLKGIFLAFSEFLVRTKSGCQLIILEHAGPEYWDDVPNTFFVGDKRWTKSDALIPNEWIVK